MSTLCSRAFRPFARIFSYSSTCVSLLHPPSSTRLTLTTSPHLILPHARHDALRQTPRAAALAWRDFRIYGRVRPWDGLVVLVRAPADPRLRDTYVFRGYVVGGDVLVGAWRHVTESVHSVPVEGAFVVGRLAGEVMGEAAGAGAAVEAEAGA